MVTFSSSKKKRTLSRPAIGSAKRATSLPSTGRKPLSISNQVAINRSMAGSIASESKRRSMPKPTARPTMPAALRASEPSGKAAKRTDLGPARSKSKPKAKAMPGKPMPASIPRQSSKQGIFSKAGSDISNFLSNVVANEVKAVQSGPIGAAYREATKKSKSSGGQSNRKRRR